MEERKEKVRGGERSEKTERGEQKETEGWEKKDGRKKGKHKGKKQKSSHLLV